MSLQWRRAAKLCQVLYQQTSSSHPVHSAKCDNFSTQVTPDRIIDGHIANQILLRGNRWDIVGINQLPFIVKTKSWKNGAAWSHLDAFILVYKEETQRGFLVKVTCLIEMKRDYKQGGLQNILLQRLKACLTENCSSPLFHSVSHVTVLLWADEQNRNLQII